MTSLWWEVMYDKRFVHADRVDGEVVVFTWDNSPKELGSQVQVWGMLPSQMELVLIDAIPVSSRVISSRDFWRPNLMDTVFRWAWDYKRDGNSGKLLELIERSAHDEREVE